MELGFETIGNATLICHDKGPVLATDPWLEGAAYFGSWIRSHKVPEEQKENVRACRYLWISHGHPDHLSPESLEGLRDKEILLPDHHGGRIAGDLRGDGYKVTVLKDGVWTQLSDNLRVCSIADYCQDAILLCDLGGKLIVNSNDAGDKGAGAFVRETVQRYDTSFLMCLTGYGDADMINFFEEDGTRIPPEAFEKKPFLDGLEEILRAFGIRYFVPFASLHKYQRTDSAWANECVTPDTVYEAGFRSPDRVLLPAFVRFDLLTEEATPIDPDPEPPDLHEPEEFGDNWSDELEPGDLEKLQAYFGSFSHLKTFLGFVNLRVGGKDNFVDIARERFGRGVTFEVPRSSLMTAVEYRVFDDILIGNFARTTMHGDWPHRGNAALYPDFNLFVTKFGDNGGAHTRPELEAYFAEYRRRGFMGFADHETGRETEQALSAYF